MPQSDVKPAEVTAEGARAEPEASPSPDSRLDAALANIPHGLCMFDADRRLVLSNSRYAKMYGLPPELLVPGTSLEAIIEFRKRVGNAPVDFPSYASHEGIAFKQEGNSLFEFTLQDGRSIRLNHMVLKDGGYVATHEDITALVCHQKEREIIEAQLHQAQKMEAVGQLTGGLAHDFNNLLGVIIGNLDFLRDAYPGDPQIEELAGQALEAALGGADLTRRLLAFARRQPLQPKRIDLTDLVTRTVKLLRRVIGEAIEVSLHFGDASSMVMADPAQLEAALTNLATNARDAMPRGGKLIIATGNRTLDAEYAASNPEVAPGEYAMIEVTDTGTGMPPEVMSHIFDPFFTTKEREKGTGLGLSMVFGFLKQSGGHISVYSEVGTGTTFRLYLPRIDDGVRSDAASQPMRVAASGGEVVLVVEDNAPLRTSAVRQLRELGYRVHEAGNGAEALSLLETSRIDVVFTDIVMPGGIDGFELANIVRRRWPEVKVVLTSGYPETRVAENLAAANFRLLTKPYRKAALAEFVRDALDAPKQPAGPPGAKVTS
ncbi:PAS domain-containing sensor histidine kinase [soil metagenome]